MDPKKREEGKEQLPVQIIDQIGDQQEKGKPLSAGLRREGKMFRQRRTLLSWSEKGTGCESGKQR
jgi:hypothetical protein